MDNQLTIGVGIALIIGGFCGIVMTAGSPWQLLGTLAAASGGAIVGASLRKRESG